MAQITINAELPAQKAQATRKIFSFGLIRLTSTPGCRAEDAVEEMSVFGLMVVEDREEPTQVESLFSA